MRPNRIILIRHAESEGNVDRSNYYTTPDFAIEITKKGKEQSFNAAQEISEIIRNESVYAYVSPYYRTRQTFNAIHSIIEENITSAIEDPRLREQDWGHLRHPDINTKMMSEWKSYSPFYYRVEDGESGADVYNRISTFLETMHRDFRKPNYPENCLIVTHGLTLRLFLMRWFHWTVEEFENTANPRNCQIIVLNRGDDDRYTL